ncbi:MAG: M17 family peptidase N-terminal domain-containing protein, partial [Hyphomonas sp.]|nr:M17 family peptidase N-terminal domain-containing protein [Hyphomonas sp.]
MKITFAESAKADIAAFIIDEGDKLPAAAAALDKASGGLLSEALEGGRFDGKAGHQVIVVLPKGCEARRAVLMGGGKPKKRDARALEKIGGSFFKAIGASGFKTASITAGDPESAARVAVGAKLAAYRFDTYFTKLKPDQKPSLSGLTVISTDPKAAKAAFAPLDAATDGTYLARDLVNLPPNDLHPESFAAKVKDLAPLGLEVEILGEKQMAKLGMGALLGVGQGSARESQLGIIKWNGGKPDEDPVVLVGKGVCFDTGG